MLRLMVFVKAYVSSCDYILYLVLPVYVGLKYMNV